VGYVFSCIVLASGPIWAKPIWGTYWTWEPRLTTTFIMWLMYSAYLLLYSYFREIGRHGYGILSVISIVTFVNIPIIHLSVKLWRGIHPSVLRNKEGLPDSMQLTLVVTLVAVISLFFLLLRQRFTLHKLEHSLQKLQSKETYGTL
jgi:heme exporter protein C